MLKKILKYHLKVKFPHLWWSTGHKICLWTNQARPYLSQTWWPDNLMPPFLIISPDINCQQVRLVTKGRQLSNENKRNFKVVRVKTKENRGWENNILQNGYTASSVRDIKQLSVIHDANYNYFSALAIVWSFIRKFIIYFSNSCRWSIKMLRAEVSAVWKIHKVL